MATNTKKNAITAIVLIVLAAVVITVGITLGPDRSGQAPVTSSVEGSLALLNLSGDTLEVGDLQHVRWTSTNYEPSTVSVNVIRKVSDSPARYELVRTVSAATANDGDAVWVPAATDVGSGVYVQVGCTLSSQACRASALNAALAVRNTGRYSNAAAAYQAIEQLNNK